MEEQEFLERFDNGEEFDRRLWWWILWPTLWSREEREDSDC